MKFIGGKRTSSKPRRSRRAFGARPEMRNVNEMKLQQRRKQKQTNYNFLIDIRQILEGKQSNNQQQTKKKANNGVV
jgi:hypothetical protein